MNRRNETWQIEMEQDREEKDHEQAEDWEIAPGAVAKVRQGTGKADGGEDRDIHNFR